MLNTHVRDNLLELRATPANRCSAYNAGTQGITAGAAAVALTFDSEEYDSATMHSTSSQTSRVTIPSGGGGTYHVNGRTQKNGVNGLLVLELRKNGGATPIRSTEANTSTVMSLVISDAVVLAAGDYLELFASHSSNDANLGSANAQSASRLTVIGPLPPT
jgi:hypothetical protein